MNNSNKVAILVLCNSQRLFELNQLIEWLVITDFYGDLILLDRGPQYMSIGDLSHDNEIWSGRIKLIPTDTKAPSSNRLLEGLAHTDKPYIAHLADDDFMMGDVLSQAVDLLDSDSSIVISGGYSYWINMIPDEKKVIFKPYQTRDFVDLQTHERLLSLVLNYNHLIYCLMRRDAFLSKHNALTNYSDICFDQYANTIISVISGRAKFINEIGHVRCTLPGASQTMFKEKSKDAFPHILLSEDFSVRFQSFKSLILDYLMTTSSFIQEEYLDEVLLQLVRWTYCGYRVDGNSFQNKMSKNLKNLQKQELRMTDLAKLYKDRIQQDKF